MPTAELKTIKPNNCRLDFSITLEHQVILNILQRHPLRFAFALDHRVPLFYLQQFWYTLAYHPVEGDPHFTAQLDDFVTRLTPTRVRRILRLPVATAAHPFDDPMTEEELCNDIRALGYDSTEPLTSPGQLKRMYLPQIWFTLFTVVNRCLTSKHTGMDKASTATLRIFYGIAFNRHYEYEMLIWTNFVELVEDKTNHRNRQFVPFQRFLQLFVHAILTSRSSAIPRRADTPLGPTNSLKFIKLNDKWFNYIMPIPEALLSLADQDAPGVITYRERNDLMARPPPVVPAHKPHHEEHNEQGEGPRIDEQVQDHGDPKQGVEQNVRDNDEGGAPDQAIPTTATTAIPILPPAGTSRSQR